ncbi:MAG: cytochrome b [Bdellovibrionales bacterium RIFCSPHIGHO2_01_FULL_40_29]|nr:MAG: cytochrome b [Bdellovibrionales bacterium RIFCSPHIGHO2_01_FULL_40_29]OFZ33862.1 MAG: cytochrome b [Bdellovibrionales bacterium RIFCSPHIGHO2_02_FULL_40_15]
MRSTLTYDLPTRLFHWLFSGLFLLSFAIAKIVDDDSIIFTYHMLMGLILGGLVLWRIVWGFFGSKHARFSGFNLNPLDLKDYFLGILSGSKKRWSGHNPASSWAAITMFALGLGSAITGYLMSTGNKETFEDIHEFMANTFIVVVILHIAGVLLHSIRHQDKIALSMVDGKKEFTENSEPIPSSRPFAASLLIALVLAAGIYLYKNFDSQNGTLQLLGQTLQLGEDQNDNGEDDDDD